MGQIDRRGHCRDGQERPVAAGLGRAFQSDIAAQGETDQRAAGEAMLPAQGVEPTYCPGGSAANVAKGVANLGGDAAFVGMIGRDDVGRRYQSLLAAQNVRPVLLQTAPGDDVSSAQCLSPVERGGQRTMRTFLGASLRMRADDFPSDEAFGEAPRLLHVEGYALYRPQLAKQAMREAKNRGALVSLDLASFEVVRNCRAALIEILSEGHVDLLFANEDEAAELLRGDETSEEARAFKERRGEESKMSSMSTNEATTSDDASVAEGSDARRSFSRRDADDAMRWMLRHCSFATVSLGARGCVSMDRAGSRGVAPGVRVPVVDTTGAGDAFTAGYLAAFLNGAGPQACASAGCAVGTAAVQVLGAELSFAKWAELRSVVLGVVERDGEFRRARGTGADGEDEFLIIDGRKEEESVGKDDVRPLPPVDRSWTPTVGENCELLYLDGWWPVRVQQLRGDKWIVIYEAFGVQHTVTRSQLRKMVAWDAATQTWKGAAK